MVEADAPYADVVGRDTSYGWLAAQRRELFPDELFLGLYIAGWGRPSVPPILLATALVPRAHDGVSDEEATRRAAYDLPWKVALGVELDGKPFATSTLQEFRAQPIVHDDQRLLSRESLERAKCRGKLGKHRKLKLALDTTPISGRGALRGTYNLLTDGIVALLRVLAAQAGVARGDRAAFVARASAAGSARDDAEASVKGGAAIDRGDPAGARGVGRGEPSCSIRRERRSGPPALSSGAPPSRRSGAAGKPSNTAWRAACSSACAGTAPSAGPRRSSNWPWPLLWRTSRSWPAEV